MAAEKEMLEKEMALLGQSLGQFHIEESDSLLKVHLEIKNKAANELRQERAEMNAL